MDERTMAQGVIPLRHSSLPGVVKLPRRYEKAALGDPRTAKHRKISICAGPLQLRETVSDRLDDLRMAIMWVKQELILLRQHDILLKHQFFNINDTIQSLRSRKSESTSTAKSSARLSTATMDGDAGDHSSITGSSSPTTCQPSTSSSCTQTTSALNIPNTYSDYHLETFLVRPSASVTLLNSQNDDHSSDSGDDTFLEDEYYRPRTSSMKTSRDLAALARRRGSKELI